MLQIIEGSGFVGAGSQKFLKSARQSRLHAANVWRDIGKAISEGAAVCLLSRSGPD